MLTEMFDPTGYAWIDSETGGVILWNRYTHTLRYATSNDPGILPARMESDPWCNGAATPGIARELAGQFFYHRF